MRIKKINQFKLFSIKIFGLFCISSFLNAQAQQIVEERAISIDTSYLKSRDELKEYILDTGDVLSIRFKNRPRKRRKKEFEEQISPSDLSYLEPRSNLKDYILDIGDSIYIDFMR